jgi:hypothetical protein
MSTLSLVFTGLLVLTTINCTLGSPVKRQVATTTPVTYQQFVNLPIGATRAQITQSFNNNPGVVTSESSFSNYLVEIVQYTNTNPIAAISLVLTNGLLTTKGQSGLSLTKYPMTFEQYNKITTGTPKAEVQSNAGAGELMGASLYSEIYGYIGSTTSYASAQITYTKGLVMSKFEYGL